jgi:hypothetical protein
MKRFTILSLMGLVVVLAVGIAALRQADDDWAGGMLLAAPLFLCIALVGGLCGREASRSRRLGFASFGWAYFALAFLGLSDDNLARLPTSRLLQYVHQQVVGTLPMNVTFTSTYIVSSVNVPTTLNVTSEPATGGGSGQVTLAQSAFGTGTPNRWKVILPGAANSEAFQSVGHCLFALIAGLMGAFVARWFKKGCREAVERGRLEMEPGTMPHTVGVNES